MGDLASYRTIKGKGTGEYREKGSKFLAFASHVRDEEEVSRQLGELKAQYHDARHHCYAWILGYDGTDYRANDDGEPGHSAGDPILGQLRSRNLTHVLCVVVRYFGGTKLGVSGLINAYKTAASDALENAKLVEHEIREALILTYAYPATNEVMRLVDEYNLRIDKQDFGELCRMEARVNISLLDALKEKTKLLHTTGSEVKLEFIRDIPS